MTITQPVSEETVPLSNGVEQWSATGEKNNICQVPSTACSSWIVFFLWVPTTNN